MTEELKNPAACRSCEQYELPLISNGVKRWVIPLPYGDILVEEFADGRILVGGSPVEMYSDTLARAEGKIRNNRNGTEVAEGVSARELL